MTRNVRLCMAVVLLWSCAEPSRPPAQSVQVPEPPPPSGPTHAATEHSPRIRVEVTEYRTDASAPRAELGELRRVVTRSVPKLQACVEQEARPVREMVTYYLTVDAKGAAQPELKLTYPPTTSDEHPVCTEYDSHMGRCERVDQPSAPPQPPGVHRRILDCWAEVLGALQLPPPEHGPFRARVEIAPELRRRD